MNEVKLKIEEALKGTQDPFFLVFDVENDGNTEFFTKNKEEIKSVIEEIIQNRKITLKQLYDLLVIYFEDKLVIGYSEISDSMEKLIEISGINSKNLKFLKTFAYICEGNPDKLEECLNDLSDLLEE